MKLIADIVCKIKCVGNGSLRVCCLLLTASCLLTSGCRRDMQDQPKMQPFRGTTFFGDGLSARPPVEGTIPRGYLRTDTALYTGKKNKALASVAAPVTPAGP